MRVSENVRELLFNDAVIVAVVLLDTAAGALTVKLAPEAPAFTVTGEDTVAAPVLLDTVTLIALGALPLKPIVHVELPGAVKLAGEHTRLESTGVAGNSVREAVCETPLNVAVIVTDVVLVTAVVVTLNVAVDEPALTVTGDETAADPLLLDTATLVLLGALPLNVIVHVEPVGGVTLVGLQLRLASVGAGSKVNVAVLETLLSVAVIVTEVVLVTAVVVTSKVAVDEPALTVTGDVTVADPLLLDTATLVLLVALPLNVMVQMDPVGGVTLEGLQLTPDSTIDGVKVREKVLDTLFNVAVIVAVVLLATVVVETLKVALDAPAFTVTGDVTVADPLLLDTATLMLLGALPLNEMVQVDPVGGVTLAGLQLRPVSVGTGGNNVTLEVLETLFNVAVIVAVVLLATAVVVTLKFALEEPELTVTGDVTVADPVLLDTATLVLLDAFPLNVMVQEKPVGGVTLVGVQLNPVNVGAGGSKVTFET